VFFTLWLAAPAQATFRQWKSGLSGDWSDASKWVNGVPMPGDVVDLGATDDGHKVRLDVDASVAAVYNGSELTIDNKTLTITGSATDTTAFPNAKALGTAAVKVTGPGHYQGGLTLDPGATLSISSPGVTWQGSVLGDGTMTIAPTGVVTTDLVMNIASRFQNRGTFRTPAVTEIVPAPGSAANDGDFEALAGGTFSLRPGPGSTFVLDKDAAVTGPGKFEISDLLAGAGTVRVDAGARFTPGTLALFGKGRLELNTNATVGKLELHAFRGDGGRYGTGELHATGDSLLLGTRLVGGLTSFDGNLLIQSGDQTSVVGGATMRTTGTTSWLLGEVALFAGAWENRGTINVTNGILSGPGLLANTATGAINKTAGTPFSGSGSLTNAGTITVSAGRFGSDVPTGTFGTLTQSAGLTNVLAGATLDKLVVLDGGVLKGRGTVRAVTNNGGTIEPGASPGTLSVTGAFSQGAAGLLRMEIESAAAFDVLAVGGAATVGGTLDLVGPYTPAPTDQLRFLTAGGILGGAFASITGGAASRFRMGVVNNALTLCPAAAASCGTPVPTPTASPTVTASPTAEPSATATPDPCAAGAAGPSPAAARRSAAAPHATAARPSAVPASPAAVDACPTATPAPSPTAVPQPTVAPQPTPAPARPVTGADLVSLPAATRCVSRLKLKLRTPAGVRIAKATYSVAGKRAKRFTGTVTLRRLPKGRFAVKVAVRLADGRSFTVTRRYRTCAPRSRSLNSHSRSLLSLSSA
jgi:hypothetical protein